MSSPSDAVRIVITGTGGVIGHALTRELTASGETNVFPLSRSHADLRNFDSTLDVIKDLKPTIIYHLAARVSGIMGNMKNRGQSYLENLLINTNVVEAARVCNVAKVVAMGTTAIYSDLAPVPMQEGDVWLGAPHHSEAPYGHAKRAMLAQLEAYREEGSLDFAYCVSTNLYGPNDRFDIHHGHVIPSLVAKMFAAQESGDDIVVWGDGTPQRDFLYAQDAARALHLIGERGVGVINVASGHPVTIREMVNVLVEVSDFRGKIVWDTTKPKGQLLREYSVERLKALGFEPRYDLRMGLGETYNWYKKNHLAARH